MAINVDKTIAALEKLYDKRAALDKSILAVQKNLATAAMEGGNLKKTATKKAAPGRKATAKKASPKE